MQHTRHGYWLAEAGAVTPAAPLIGERSADVVVIGGGFTGMWTAWQIKALEPEARVVLLEAEVCGGGPSGRNGGFVNTMWFSLPSMRRRWGDQPALAVARAAAAAVAEIGDFCLSEGVEAWYRRGGYLQVSTAPAHDAVWEQSVRACQELGVSDAVQTLTPAEVAARCASPAFRGGVLYPGAATVQPARLALGLRERLQAAGIEVCEFSPVRSLRGEGEGCGRRPAPARFKPGRPWLRSARRRRRPPGRFATNSRSPHLTSSSPSRFRIFWRKWVGPTVSASPTVAP